MTQIQEESCKLDVSFEADLDSSSAEEKKRLTERSVALGVTDWKSTRACSFFLILRSVLSIRSSLILKLVCIVLGLGLESSLGSLTL